MRRLVIAISMAMIATLQMNAQGKKYHGDGIDDALRFVPLAGAIGMKVAGIESRSNTKDFIWNTALSTVVTAGITYGLKQTIHDMRPDRTDNHGFPSGHSSLAFSGATILHKEFHHVSPWISVTGYVIASATAIDRIRRNRHEWDDVLAGAAIGIAATEFSYWINGKLNKKKDKYQVALSATSMQLKVNL